MKKIILFSLLIAALVVMTGCITTGGSGRAVTGRGSMETFTIDAIDFTGINIGGAYNLYFNQVPTFSVELEIQSNLFEHIEANVRNGVLTFDSNRTINTTSGNAPRLTITAPDITYLNIRGAVSGDLHMDVDTLDVTISGAATLTLAGTVHDLTVTSLGAADINAFDLRAVRATVTVSGASNVDVYASETLNAALSGVGRIRYDGDAEVSRRVTGIGTITRR